MKACVLVAAPLDRVDAIAEALAAFQTRRVSDAGHAKLLAVNGHFQAVVAAPGYLADVGEPELGGAPLIHLASVPDLNALPALVEAAVRRARANDYRRAGDLEPLSALRYGEYVELVRFRATRRYLLGLMRRHRGSVTEASLAAGIARESLHRQLRRHDVDATAFRDPDPG